MRYEGRSTPKTWHTRTNSNSVRASSRFKAMYLERSWGVVSASMGRPAPPATGWGGTVGPDGWCRARARPLGGGMLTSGSSFGSILIPTQARQLAASVTSHSEKEENVVLK